MSSGPEAPGKRIVRTLLWAVVLGVTAWALLIPMDALGRVIPMPPSYRIGARIMVGAMWAVGVAAVWAYRPVRGGEPRGDGEDG